MGSLLRRLAAIEVRANLARLFDDPQAEEVRYQRKAS